MLVRSTDPSSLTVHMNAPDMFSEIRTGVEELWTEVPATRVSHRLCPGRASAALSVHHGRGGAPAGHCALHLHQGAADTTSRERAKKQRYEEPLT